MPDDPRKPPAARKLQPAIARHARPKPRSNMRDRRPPCRGECAATRRAIDPFVFRFSIFVLAVFVGYYVVWSVTPALHTPLMSVTNAISSVIVVGALLAVGVDAGRQTIPARSGRACSASSRSILASVNIFGGFLVTQRMLAMYQKKKRDAPMTANTCRAALSRRRRPLHPGAARAVEPGDEPAGQPVRHDRHGDRDRHDARVASAGRRRRLDPGDRSASASAAASAR